MTPIELDYVVIIGRERIVTVREGAFGWPGERWSGEVIIFDAEQRITKREPAAPDGAGLVAIELPEGGAAAIVRD